MDEMFRVAHVMVLRACAFGSLGIFCFMVGLSFEPRLAFQAGGLLTLGMTGILFYKAQEARSKPYRRTEMWLYLPEEARPPATSAQQITSAVLYETYMTFARWTSVIAIVMWAVALLFSLAGL